MNAALQTSVDHYLERKKERANMLAKVVICMTPTERVIWFTSFYSLSSSVLRSIGDYLEDMDRVMHATTAEELQELISSYR
jgi:hypothetical protein